MESWLKNMSLKKSVNTLHVTFDNIQGKHRMKIKKLSKKVSYLSKKNSNLRNNLHNCNIEVENRIQENIILNRENKIVNDELNNLQNENNRVITKYPDSRRYTDDLRTCIFELQGIDIPSNKISNVIRSATDSETVATVIKDTLVESASYQNVNVQKFLLSLSAMMRDLSSIMKKSNKNIDEWRSTMSTELSQQLNDVEVQNKEQDITVGTWVAISFEDDWYLGEVLQLKPDNILNNLMVRQRKRRITFKWPSKEDIKDIDVKCVIYLHFDNLPSPGLRHWIIPDIDDINHHHNQFVEKYFV
ncbi:unnamed protein product [Mytilus coruscus]|uniref:Uncharacterized protein n=1 Tax=Mytilus coruscus TaxID=42192 RepID=A0A6J8DGC9_MYTCO|nr:unnamed protein product [Mytilus coruscus]